MRVDKDLVEQLVVQILGQLSAADTGERVLVLGSRDEADKIPLTQGGARVKVFCEEDVYATEEIDRYILPKLELDDMADLAAGKAGSSRAGTVLSLLLQGKKVEVADYAYTGFEDSAPSPLYQLYVDYAETLAGFGLVPLSKKVRKATRLQSRVVSEKDIEQCSKDGVNRVSVSRTAIVTSLAEETARKFGIEIQREE